jgi:hypothetical protein
MRHVTARLGLKQEIILPFPISYWPTERDRHHKMFIVETEENHENHVAIASRGSRSDYLRDFPKLLQALDGIVT